MTSPKPKMAFRREQVEQPRLHQNVRSCGTLRGTGQKTCKTHSHDQRGRCRIDWIYPEWSRSDCNNRNAHSSILQLVLELDRHANAGQRCGRGAATDPSSIGEPGTQRQSKLWNALNASVMPKTKIQLAPAARLKTSIIGFYDRSRPFVRKMVPKSNF